LKGKKKSSGSLSCYKYAFSIVIGACTFK